MTEKRETVIIEHADHGVLRVYRDEYEAAVEACRRAGGVGGGARYATYTPVKDEDQCKNECKDETSSK